MFSSAETGSGSGTGGGLLEQRKEGLETKWKMAVDYNVLIAWKCKREAPLAFYFLFSERFVKEHQAGNKNGGGGREGGEGANNVQQEQF